MKLILEAWKLKNLSFNEKDLEEIERNHFKLIDRPIFFKGDKKRFAIQFQIKLRDEEFDFDATMDYIFKCDKVISKEFKDSQFVKINAPAIAFPYLRAYISNLSLQSGYPPIILPSINFVEFKKNQELSE